MGTFLYTTGTWQLYMYLKTYVHEMLTCTVP